MQRQPFGNARYRENAQLPETFPIVKDASKEFGSARKRKATSGNQDLRVRQGFFLPEDRCQLNCSATRNESVVEIDSSLYNILKGRD